MAGKKKFPWPQRAKTNWIPKKRQAVWEAKFILRTCNSTRHPLVKPIRNVFVRLRRQPLAVQASIRRQSKTTWT